jgi:hypothetical protein
MRTWVWPLGVVRMPAYRYPYQVSSTSTPRGPAGRSVADG